MARRKMFNTEERIKQVEAEIDELQNKLKAKKSELKSLNIQLEQENKQKVLHWFSVSGKTIQEVEEFFTSSDNKENK